MLNFEILETSRMTLKGLSPTGMNYIFEHLTKPEIMAVLGHRSEEDYQTDAHKQKHGFSSYNRSFLLFLLEDKATGKIIGRAGLHNWNKEHKRAEIGYVMEDEDSKRRGLMTEAVQAIIAHGFNVLGLNRIEALVGVNNAPSLRLMEKNGFTQEGLLRQHHFMDGSFEDTALFSKLRVEYLADY